MQSENSNSVLLNSSSNMNKKGVIILGETGVGKSNLGNFIVKKEDFKVS